MRYFLGLFLIGAVLSVIILAMSWSSSRGPDYYSITEQKLKSIALELESITHELKTQEKRETDLKELVANIVAKRGLDFFEIPYQPKTYAALYPDSVIWFQPTQYLDEVCLYCPMLMTNRQGQRFYIGVKANADVIAMDVPPKWQPFSFTNDMK